MKIELDARAWIRERRRGGGFDADEGLGLHLHGRRCHRARTVLPTQDIEWLTLNQITHIVNCAGRHSQNNTAVKGMCFLTFDWSENSVQTIIDQSVISAVFGFVEEARGEQGTVLVHGWRSESRPFCLLAIYFMIK